MDKKLFELGLSKRKATLGKESVEKNLDSADEFNEDFQKQMTEWCWGFGWGDDTIDAKTRSMMNLTMLAALGKMDEFEVHLKGALTNGVSVSEIKSILHVIAIYCGVPQGVECFKIARVILEEAGEL